MLQFQTYIFVNHYQCVKSYIMRHVPAYNETFYNKFSICLHYIIQFQINFVQKKHAIVCIIVLLPGFILFHVFSKHELHDAQKGYLWLSSLQKKSILFCKHQHVQQIFPPKIYFARDVPRKTIRFPEFNFKPLLLKFLKRV